MNHQRQDLALYLDDVVLVCSMTPAPPQSGYPRLCVYPSKVHFHFVRVQDMLAKK